MTIYLDCNATTPIEPEVADLVMHYMREEYGNAGSRTHEFGLRAKRAVELARKQVARIVEADPSEVIFTSGATESNNLAILGLAAAAEAEGKRHIISSSLEHKAVLEPLDHLRKRGFEVELPRASEKGWIEPSELEGALRPDTALVSLMSVNNETGVKQPISSYADVMDVHDAYLHTDAAQGYGKDVDALCNPRIDLISISGHKVYAPMGVGALIARRRGYDRIPLSPLMFGGGQERGIRPGTLPVPLIAGLGLASEISTRDRVRRNEANAAHLGGALDAMTTLGGVSNGEISHLLGTALNFSLPGVDSEAIMLSLKGIAAISNGSACTSHDYRGSHVLEAMEIGARRIDGALRISWSHLTGGVDWGEIVSRVSPLMPQSTAKY